MTAQKPRHSDHSGMISMSLLARKKTFDAHLVLFEEPGNRDIQIIVPRLWTSL